MRWAEYVYLSMYTSSRDSIPVSHIKLYAKDELWVASGSIQRWSKACSNGKERKLEQPLKNTCLHR